MPEIRYRTITTYDSKGKVLETQSIPYPVSDEEIGEELAEKDLEKLKNLNDADLTLPLVGKFLRALARLRRHS